MSKGRGRTEMTEEGRKLSQISTNSIFPAVTTDQYFGIRKE